MTDHSQVPTADQPGPDLEYDLAHDAVFLAGSTAAPLNDAEPEHITVATGTPEYSGDYSYDLAHDVPGR